MNLWNKIYLKEQTFHEHSFFKDWTVVTMALSFNKEYLAIGYSNGSITIVNSMESPTTPVGVLKP